MLADGHAADHYNPGAQSGPCCTMVGRSSAPWRLVCARGRAHVSSECDSWTKKYVIADMHATIMTWFLTVTRSPIDAPFSTKAPSQMLQSRPMRALARTWANAQTHVPCPISWLLHNPHGSTETPSSGKEVVTAPPISF